MTSQNIATPSQLRRVLDELEAAPLKRLSQNFLIDGNIARNIVDLAKISPGNKILEIGPGAGALTEIILSKGADLVAIEKDRKLAASLRERFPSLELFEGDVLDFDWNTLKGKYKVVANLPYHLTSPILGLLMPRVEIFSDLFLMMQKEVALRIIAKSNEKAFSLLTLFTNFYSTPKIAIQVTRRAFFPAPKVDSSVVHFNLRKRELDFDAALFFDIAKKAFQQRRKMLSTSLKPFYSLDVIQKTLVALSLPKEARPEALSLEEWLQFVSMLSKISR